MRRLQRRIAEGKISQEKIAAYFSNTSKTPATLDPLKIDDYGNIQNWPEIFFGDEMGDIIDHTKAAMKKKKQESRQESGASQ